MTETADSRLVAFRRSLDEEYRQRFPRSVAHLERGGRYVFDGTSHAIRWNDPFMPIVRRASGAAVEDLDGHRLIDYWQGHFANILGHNPRRVRDALSAALEDGRGLQSGMLHELEAEVAERICRCTGADTVRLTTSGTLGTFYSSLLARAFTGRDRVLKVGGGWHGSQPFALKGVSPHGSSFDHLESEGLSPSADPETVVTRFNDVDDLRRTFERTGDRLACFVVEPMLGAGGGLVATRDYLREARRLTEKHGALLLCDEIITGFRFRAGDLSSLYGIKPDLWILGKIIGGGMPLAAVAGRADVMQLCSRESGRVKFEGGTYSAHELSMVAAVALIDHLIEHEESIYSRLATLGERLREGVRRVAAEAGMRLIVLGRPGEVVPGSSLVFVYAGREGAEAPCCPEELAEREHPLIGERLMKSTLMLENLSVRSGLGSISAAHTDEDLDTTLDALRAGLQRFRRAGLA